MNKTFKHIMLTVLLMLVTVFTFALTVGAEVLYEGDLNEETGISYVLDDSGVLTISGNAETLVYSDPITGWNDYKQPWHKNNGNWASNVKELVIDMPNLTSIGQYAIGYLTACEKITFPTSLTDFSKAGNMNGAENLKSVRFGTDTDYVENVIDFRNILKMGAYSFDGAFKKTTPTVLLNKDVSLHNSPNLAKDCKGLTFKVYPGSDAADMVNSYIESAKTETKYCQYISIEYFTNADDSSIAPFTGSVYEYSTKYAWTTAYQWILNPSDWSLEISQYELSEEQAANKDAINEFGYTSTNANFADYKTFKATWSGLVKSIEVGSVSKLSGDLLSNYPNCETILFNSTYEVQPPSSGFFANNAKLKTVGLVGDYTENVADLSFLGTVKAGSMAKFFSGCSSVTAVKFPESVGGTKFTSVESGMFNNCSALTSVEIPAYLTTVTSDAFNGCTALKKITVSESLDLENSVFPDQENLLIFCPTKAMAESINSSGMASTKAVYFDDSIKANSFRVRTRSYDGLRGIFKFDKTAQSDMEAAGFELVEYGAIVASEENYNEYGADIALDENGNYVTAHTSIQKRPVFDADDTEHNQYPGNRLEDTDDYTLFAITVKEYMNLDSAKYDISSILNSKVYMRAYSVYKLNDEYYVSYSDFSEISADYKTFSIYQIMIEMFSDGVINSNNTDDVAVWNVLTTGGLVTLSAESDYTYNEGDTLLDETTAIGSQFVFESVPACYQTVKTTDGVKTIEFSPSSASITLLYDSNGTDYIAVYKGTGVIPGSAAWQKEGSHQLSSGFCGSASVAAKPNPTLTSTATAKIKTIVIDHNITGIKAAAFSRLGALETLVYPESITSVEGTSLFTDCVNLTTAYCADTQSEIAPVRERTIVDLSKIPSIKGIDYLIHCCDKVQNVHLPATVTATGNGMNGFANGADLIERVWCGDVYADAEGGMPESGVLDVRLVKDLTKIGDKAFHLTAMLDTIMLPDTVKELYDVNGTETRYAFDGKTAKVIITDTAVDDITAFVEENGETLNVTYEILNPNVLSMAGWSRIIVA